MATSESERSRPFVDATSSVADRRLAGRELVELKREVIEMGYRAVFPRTIVWGVQPEEVRKYGHRLMTIRRDLLEWPREKLLDFIQQALSDETIGHCWDGKREKKAQGYSEERVETARGYAVLKRKNRREWSGEAGPTEKRCSRCGRSSTEGARFHKRRRSRDGLTKTCVDCIMDKYYGG